MNQQEREQHIRTYLNGHESVEGKALFTEWADQLFNDPRFLESLTPQQLSRFEAELWAGILQRTNLNEAQAYPFRKRHVNPEPGRRLGGSAFFRYGIAAAVALLLLVGYAYWRQLPGVNLAVPGASVVAYREVSTPLGKRLAVTLLDGSRIVLNAGSRLRYPTTLTGPTRQVYLTGEAFFAITPNPQKSFIVRTQTLTTTVKGTSFNVSSYADDTHATVTVLTGKVAVVPIHSHHPARLLRPGQQVVYQPTADAFTLETLPDPARATGWQRSTLSFRRTPLSAVARQLERQYGLRVRLDNPALATCTVVGEFSQMPLRAVLPALCESVGATYTIDGDGVRIAGSGCP